MCLLVVVCGAGRAEQLAALRAAQRTGGAPALLLLHADEDAPLAMPNTNQTINNITVALRNLPYPQTRENLTSNKSTYISKTPNLSSDLRPLHEKSFPSSLAYALVNNITARPYRKKRTRQESADILRTENVVNTIKNSTLENQFRNYFPWSYNNTRSAKQTFQKNKFEDIARLSPVQGRASNRIRLRRDSAAAQPPTAEGAAPLTTATPAPVVDIFNYINPFLFQLGTYQQHIFLLTTGHGRVITESFESIVYDEILESLNRQEQAEQTRMESSEIRCYLYERIIIKNDSFEWKFITNFVSTSSRSLDDTEDWVTTVKVSNSTCDFEYWSLTHAATEYDLSPKYVHGILPAVFACCALFVATTAALITRYVTTRRRLRKRRGDAVLMVGDFSFPADERRRVGEGMETMLSCWLQQLHEFGGPELEKPDLLKQSPRSIPPPIAAPSAPSSTCSVNRLNPDRRIRYKGDAVHMKYLPASSSLELRRRATDVLLVMQNIRHENLNPFIGCLCDVRPALVFDACGRGSLEDVLMADDIKLDWTFRLSLLTDLVKGMRYLHASPLRQHGRLSSRNCVVDSRWVLRITDYGLPSFYRAQGWSQPVRSARDSNAINKLLELLWTSPEVLREERGMGRGSQPGDVKINIVDSMFEMLEKYSNNLEDLIKERTEQLDMEKKKTEQLLNRMLPGSVAERLILGLRVEPEEFEEVSIYFSDIVGFTALAARATPVQVVDLLNDLYTVFDAAIEQYSVYKVETIGDAYMVVGGLPNRARDHAESIANMALHLLHLAGRFRIRHAPTAPLHLRIGLHTGPCCAGVRGSDQAPFPPIAVRPRRCLASGPRGLRRQWSLERGDALAVAAGARGALPTTPTTRSPSVEPLALLAPPAPRLPPARYRTRPDAPMVLSLAQIAPAAPAPTQQAGEDAHTPMSCPP
ncbi:hypothetical protein MSG28_000727 [Choristoneura fumiferana]|uniref:Uncharacterized protein n=1 Tax=Choristoneura fumiferana TaxID=7141 RepID=A0ACC0K2H1_CHOFU|nr:hypothetical protein MSG28_000727 [Choristoneura fumiferana]